MNEHGFWGKVRGALKEAEHGFASKLSDLYVAGTPDCIWAIQGRMGLLELKYVPRWPARDTTLVKVNVSVEQRRYLEAVAATGNHAHVLLGVQKDWFLIYLHELPETRLSRVSLEGIRRQGRAGTFKTLNTLPRVLLEIPAPVFGT